MSKHYREHRARQQFARKLEQLRVELSAESDQRVLDYLLDHLETLLELVGDSILLASFRAQFEEAKRSVASRHRPPPRLHLVKPAS